MSYSKKYLESLPKYLRASIPLKGRVIGIDLDGVVADYDAYTGVELAKGRSIHDIYNDEGSFRNLPLIEGAKEGVEWLDKHFEIYFISTAMWSNPSSWTDKRLWVEDHFPKIGKKKLILTHNKGLFNGDFIIDDRIANGVGDFKGIHIHFGQGDFPSWVEVLSYFKVIKENAT